MHDVMFACLPLIHHVKRSDLGLTEPAAKMKYRVKHLMFQNITVTGRTGLRNTSVRHHVSYHINPVSDHCVHVLFGIKQPGKFKLVFSALWVAVITRKFSANTFTSIACGPGIIAHCTWAVNHTTMVIACLHHRHVSQASRSYNTPCDRFHTERFVVRRALAPCFRPHFRWHP